VLKRWQASPKSSGGRFEWVMEKIRESFPELISGLEFVGTGLGEYPVFFGPNDASDTGLPVHLAADGLLTGLLHLTAIAGAEPGAVIAFDEIENQLHPHAIHMLLKAMRTRAEQNDLTIIMTTHSPVVMNTFQNDLVRFFVLDPQHAGSQPARLTELYDVDWLVHFEVGDLYGRERIVPQSATAPAPKT